MRSPEQERRVLVVDPDLSACTAAMQVLGDGGMAVQACADAESGMRAIATLEPQVVLLELEFPGKDGLWLLRRLRDEYMGARPRVVVSTSASTIAHRIGDLGVDAVVLKPASPAALLAACAEGAWVDERAREPEQLRELIRLSILTGDLQGAFTTLAKRLALCFRMTECVVVATASDRQVLGCARGPIDESPDAPIWDICQVALDAGAPVMVANEAGLPSTHIAVPIESVGGTRLGVLLLVDEGARLLSNDLCDSLRALGQRLYGELAWRSVHDRIAADRDRLRESSMIDPLLGVWTRAALDQALPGEVSASQRRGESLSVAVLNLRGLRHVNEKYGHVVGDDALRHIAALTRHALRTQDLVARYAGDSLVLVLAGANGAEARMVVDRIALSIASVPLEHGEDRIQLQVVAGIAPLLGDDDTGEAAIARALWAVGAAKRRRESIVLVETTEAADMVAAAPTSLEPGTTLGGMYQILHEISRGAMGVVYRAEDLGLGRPVALKTLRHDLARDRNFVERFRIEAATLAAIRHEHLVQVYAFGTDGEDVYFVMELVEGEPLEDRVEMARHEGKNMPLALIESVVLQTAGALDAMHRAGVLHRDVKPSNILLDRERSRAVLVDVGIAKKRGTAHDPAGTPGFTAPESFVGGAEGPSSDGYGLAATAYTLLTATPPFGDGALETILGRQQKEGPAPARNWRPSLAQEVEDVLTRAMDPDPPSRYATASEFAQALARALRKCAEHVRTGQDGLGSSKPGVFDPMTSPPEAAFAPVASLRPESFEPATNRPVTGVGAAGSPDQAVTGTRVVGGTHAGSPRPGSGPIPVAPPPRRVSAQIVAAQPPPPMASLRLPSLREPDAPTDGVPHTRGVLFRSAYRVLGARQGAAWVSHVSRREPALAHALQPQNTLLSWHPTELFVLMLRAIAESGRDARAFGRELGRVAASTTFSRFFGADPAALSPAEVLAATDLIWKRYHTWGTVVVERSGELETMVTIDGGPTDDLVWATAAGILEQVAVLSGAANSTVDILSKDAKATGRCQLKVRWQLAPRPAG